MLEVKLDHNASGLIGGCNDTALLDQPYKRAFLWLPGGSRRIDARGTGQTPRELLEWIERIGTGKLKDPKHASSKDYKAIVESEGSSRAKFYF